MTTVSASATDLSKRARGFLGAGIGIIVAWGAVNFFPEKVAPWATTDLGKSVLLIVQVGLFLVAIGALIKVCSLLAQMLRGVKITKLKWGKLELNFEAKEGEDDTV